MMKYYYLVFILLSQIHLNLSYTVPYLTWVQGSNESSKYFDSIIEYPKGRFGSMMVITSDQELWLFGGGSYNNLDHLVTFNDIWLYSIEKDEFVRIRESNSINVSPSPRCCGVLWLNEKENAIYLFGGYSGTEYLNDLWKYSYLNDEWAMIDEGSDYGVYEGENLRPGGRAYSSFWVEEDPDYIWVFGGRGCDANQCSDENFLNDLWRYSVNSGAWSFMSGNIQGTGGGFISGNLYREGSSTIYSKSTKNNIPMLIQIGGAREPNIYYNDILLMIPKDFSWNTLQGNKDPFYGTLGNKSKKNMFGKRAHSASWYDDENMEFWIFGGFGLDNDSNFGNLNDLWVLNAKDGLDTVWLGGSKEINSHGNYGNKNEPSTSNIPSARSNSAVFFDKANRKAWLFGGLRKDSLETYDDLWSIYLGPASIPCTLCNLIDPITVDNGMIIPNDTEIILPPNVRRVLIINNGEEPILIEEEE